MTKEDFINKYSAMLDYHVDAAAITKMMKRDLDGLVPQPPQPDKPMDMDKFTQEKMPAPAVTPEPQRKHDQDEVNFWSTDHYGYATDKHGNKYKPKQAPAVTDDAIEALKELVGHQLREAFKSGLMGMEWEGYYYTASIDTFWEALDKFQHLRHPAPMPSDDEIDDEVSRKYDPTQGHHTMERIGYRTGLYKMREWLRKQTGGGE